MLLIHLTTSLPRRTKPKHLIPIIRIQSSQAYLLKQKSVVHRENIAACLFSSSSSIHIYLSICPSLSLLFSFFLSLSLYLYLSLSLLEYVVEDECKSWSESSPILASRLITDYGIVKDRTDAEPVSRSQYVRRGW